MSRERLHFSDIKNEMTLSINKVLAKRGETITLRRRKSVYENVELSDKEKRQIDNFYNKYFDKKVPYEWHRLYKGYTGFFDKMFMPDFIYSGYIEPKWNRSTYSIALSDKNLQGIVFSDVEGVRSPLTYVKCINGILFDKNSSKIDLGIAVLILQEIGEIIIKKTIETNSGRDVNIYNFHNGIDVVSGKSVEEVLSALPKNFVAQEKIKPYKTLADIYPKAINTFRVITYIWNSDFYIAPIVMRIGRNGATVDNAHAGGIMIAVHDDGTLSPCAYSIMGERFYKHPDTGTEFKNVKFGFIDELKKVAIALHQRVPELGIVSWDLTVDENGRIVLIEANTRGQAIWLSQSVHGTSFFGENTAAILKSLK